MAVVEFDRRDLESLVGKKIRDEEYKNVLPMIGTPLEGLSDDVVQFEIFPNRPDLLSIEGYARAARNFLKIKNSGQGQHVQKVKRGRGILKVEKSVKTVRPYVVGAVIRNVKLTDELVKSLMQVQEKIHETFGRKRKKVAIGIHDLDKVGFPFVYKAVAPESVSFVPLDMHKNMNLKEILENHPKGVLYKWILNGMKKYPIILDKNKNVLSFPPIINGELTKVTDETRTLFIDITGLCPHAIEYALNIIVTSLIERGCTAETVKIIDTEEKVCPNLKPKKVKLGLDYLNKLLGLNLKEKELKELMNKMGLDYKNGKTFVPCYRTDVMHPIDIVEDIAIAFGYEKFKERMPHIPTIGVESEKESYNVLIKELMLGLGFQEVVSFVLTNMDNQFKKMGTKNESVAEVLNPKTEDYVMCRKWVLPSLVCVLTQNKHRDYPQKIFEIGDCVLLDNKMETKTADVKKLCAVVSHSKANINEIQSILESLLKNLGIKYKIQNHEHPSFISGRCGKVLVNEKNAGFFGEICPKVLSNWKLENPVSCFELNINEMIC